MLFLSFSEILYKMSRFYERHIRGDCTSSYLDWADIWAHTEARNLGQVSVVHHISNREACAVMRTHLESWSCGVIGVAQASIKLSRDQAEFLSTAIHGPATEAEADPVFAAWKKLYPRVSRVPSCVQEAARKAQGRVEEGPIMVYLIFATVAGVSFIVDFTRQKGVPAAVR